MKKIIGFYIEEGLKKIVFEGLPLPELPANVIFLLADGPPAKFIDCYFQTENFGGGKGADF